MLSLNKIDVKSGFIDELNERFLIKAEKLIDKPGTVLQLFWIQVEQEFLSCPLVS